MRRFIPAWTLQYGFYAEMGGFKLVDETTGQQYPFRTAQLHWLAQSRLISMPAITKKDIRAKSKASRLAKTLACLQSAHTIIYTPSISKENLRRPAEATCFSKKSGSWYRPAVKETRSRGWDFYWFEKSTDMKTLSLVRGNKLVPSELHDFVKHSEAETRVASWYLPSVSELLASEWDNVNDTVLVLAGWFFNGLHLAAWNNQFPTDVESLLWKISVCLMLGYIASAMPVAVMLAWLPPGSVFKDLPLWMIIPCYAVTRLYLMTEVFVGLRSASPTVFTAVNWTRYIPGISTSEKLRESRIRGLAGMKIRRGPKAKPFEEADRFLTQVPAVHYNIEPSLAAKTCVQDILRGKTDIAKAKLLNCVRSAPVNINLYGARPRARSGNPVRFGEMDSRGRVSELAAPFFGSRPSRQTGDVEDAVHDFGAV
ncbi:MAG: hypothetical protein Q9173_006118 [Seirophora scorigena]